MFYLFKFDGFTLMDVPFIGGVRAGIWRVCKNKSAVTEYKNTNKKSFVHYPDIW
jgi:hypothetical protein